jgi:hypothetical protein
MESVVDAGRRGSEHLIYVIGKAKQKAPGICCKEMDTIRSGLANLIHLGGQI